MNGVCTTRACSNLGGGSCIDSSTLSQCDLQGAGQTTVSCAASEVCAGGACVPGQCVEGQTRCGDFYTTLSCTAGAWVASRCDGTDVCAIGSDGEAACEPARCVAQSARCDGNVSVLCNADGSTETRTSCASNEICDAGWCRVKICGEELSTPSSSDAAQSNDAGTDNDGGSKPTPDVFIPPLEPLPVLTFKFGASAKEYNLNVRADYIATEKALKIQGGKSGAPLLPP